MFSDFSDVTSIVCYLTFIVFPLTHASRKNPGITNGRLRVRLASLWTLLSCFAIDAIRSAICRCAVLILSDSSISETEVVSSHSSARRLVAYDDSWVCRLFDVVSVASNALWIVARCFPLAQKYVLRNFTRTTKQSILGKVQI